MHHDTQCSSLGSLVFACLGSIKKDTMQLYVTYIILYYNYIPLLLQYHKLYINTHLSVWLPVVLVYRVSPLLISKLILSDVNLS